jgi:hypothetical protein
MLSIWPENQPMSRVADFACCAILDFRSPCGNDYNNQGMPSGMSAVALKATSDQAAKAGLLHLSLEQSGAEQSGIQVLGNYRKDYPGQTDLRPRANKGTGRGAGFGSGTIPSVQGQGIGHTANRPTGNR